MAKPWLPMAPHCDNPPGDAPPRWLAVAEIGLIFAVFFIHAAWPPPEVNEAHYLGKARHYWNPDWCPADFFLNSVDAHQVFYWTFGWVAAWLPLPTAAWIGRLVTWLLLAISWRRLSATVVDAPLSPVLSAALFVTLSEHTQMAGEWMVGGVEAKGFAYACILWGLADLVAGRWKCVWPWFGGAAAFHVVIGGWAVVAGLAAWAAAGKSRTPLSSMVVPLGIGFVLSLAALIPAVLLTYGADPELVRQANRIYVFERLPHHLVLQSFSGELIVRELLLLGVWLLVAFFFRGSAYCRRLNWFVAGSLAIATVGAGLSVLSEYQPDIAAALLRFYWFRLSDVLLPLGTAQLAALVVVCACRRRPRLGAALLLGSMILCGLHLGGILLRKQQGMWPPADASIYELSDWRAVCRWTGENTPRDALFLTPRLAATFRWYSGRSEVVNQKDIPQDAAGIVEWRRRLEALHGSGDPDDPWRPSLAAAGAQRLDKLSREYGAEYIITETSPPLPFEMVSPLNPSYVVYRLPRDPK